MITYVELGSLSEFSYEKLVEELFYYDIETQQRNENNNHQNISDT